MKQLDKEVIIRPKNAGFEVLFDRAGTTSIAGYALSESDANLLAEAVQRNQLVMWSDAAEQLSMYGVTITCPLTTQYIRGKEIIVYIAEIELAKISKKGTVTIQKAYEIHFKSVQLLLTDFKLFFQSALPQVVHLHGKKYLTYELFHQFYDITQADFSTMH